MNAGIVQDLATPTKACGRCHQIKGIVEFNQDKNKCDGRQSVCRECSRANSTAWCAANAERSRASAAAWYADNHERARNTRRAWAVSNPDMMREKCARRRARRASAPVVERIYRAKVWARDGGRCHICHRPCDPNNWHLDHLVSLALGGEHSYRNVAVSHPKCNMRKHAAGPAQLRLEVAS